MPQVGNVWKMDENVIFKTSGFVFGVLFALIYVLIFLDKPRPGGHTAMGKDALARARECMTVGPVNVRRRLIDIYKSFIDTVSVSNQVSI